MTESWDVMKVLNWTAEYFEQNDIEKARLNAELLISGILKMKRLDLYLKFDKPLADDELKSIKSAIIRRIKGEPIQYILGKQNFFGYDFIVNKDVLIPRPETEQMVDFGIKLIKKNNFTKILDLCTGSGCIGITIAKELINNELNMSASDLSSKALEIAKKNADLILGEKSNINFIESDLFEKIDRKFELIISNPPYISKKAELKDEVKKYEPSLALFADEEGLALYRKIAETSHRYLCSNGYLILEIGDEQGEKIKDIFEKQNNFYEFCGILKDLAEKDRIIYFKRKEEY